MQDSVALSIIRRFEEACGVRGNWESHWEEIARRVLPNYAGSFTSQGMVRSQGEKRTDEMVDATAAVALGRFSAAMESMLTPRNSRWHRCVPSDRVLMKNRLVRLWFEELTDTLFKYRYAPRANYASQQHEIYMGLGAFGTGALFIDKLKTGGLRYRAIHLGEIYFLENHQGIIDTALRKFPLTARQARQWFGADKLPEKIKVALADNESSKKDKEFYFIHCVTPREDYVAGRKDVKGMLHTSHYVAVDDQVVVQEGGYNSFPYAISRYVVAPGELYGRSPAMTALPAIKVLNEEKRTVLKQGHRVVDPVLLAHDDGVVDAFSLKPGAINFGAVSAEGKPLVHVLPSGNLALAREMMDAERMVINDVFLVTLFQILVDTPQMTATEVIERAREKGALLSPTMGRQQSEALGPMIEREVDVLAAQGLISPMPQILRDARGQFDIEYDSPLSRAQKSEAGAGTMRTIGWASDIYKVTQDPSVLDPFNWDIIIPDLADINAMPVRYLATEEQIAAKRAARQEAQGIQQATEALPAIAGLMKAAPASAAAK
jgi:hypothetical protein